jgi:MFS family permease
VRRNAALFVLISLFDGFGSTAMGISAGLWLLDLTHSVPLAALAGICTYAPVFLGPWIGTVVDRLPRRPLMVATEAATTLLLLTLLTVHSAGTAWLIFAILLTRGLLGALVDAGETAILPSALPPASLGTVNGWRSSALEGTKLLAPLAGAGLYAWQGPTPVVLLCATIPLISATCYTLLTLPNSPQPPLTPATEMGAVPAAGVGAVPGPEVRAVLAADVGAVPGADVGAVPGADVGAVPGADVGAVPGADVGAVPGADVGAVPGAGGGAEPNDRSSAEREGWRTTKPERQSQAEPESWNWAQPQSQSRVESERRSTVEPDGQGRAKPERRRTAKPEGRGTAEPEGRGRAGPEGRGGAEPERQGQAEPEGRGTAEAAGRGGAWAGVALMFRLPAVRIPVLVAAVAIAMSGLTNAAVLAHLVDDLHLPSTRLGLVTSAQGAGSILSGLLVGRLLARLGPTRVAVLGAVLFGVGRLAWVLPWFPPALAGSLVIGLGLPWTLIAGITAIQTETPDHLLGRVAASSNTVMFGPVALAIPLGSAMVHLGSRTPTLTAVALSFTAALFGTWALRRTPNRSLLHADAPPSEAAAPGTRR